MKFGDASGPDTVPRYAYRLYGLDVVSTAPLPALAPATVTTPDVSIDVVASLPATLGVGTVLWHTGSTHGPVPFEMTLRADDAGFEIVKKGATVAVTRLQADGTRVCVHVGDAFREDALCLLLHPELSWIAALRGRICLHANVVAVGKGAIAMIGSSGAGKSTLTAALWRGGHAVVADDVCAVDPGSASVYSGIPRPKLSVATLESLGMAQHSSEPLFRIPPPGPAKAWLEGLAPDLADRRPLRALFVLEGRTPGLDHPQLRRLGKGEALLALEANSRGREVLDKTAKRRQFHAMAALAARVPVFGVRCPDDLGRLDDCAGAILEATPD